MSFAALHRPGDPFVLPNAWDVGTARALAGARFPAVGTTSLGVTSGQGLLDGVRAGRDLSIDLVGKLLASDLGCWVTCDLEDGFSDDPVEVADLVVSLASLGVAGVNLEDATDGILVNPEAHARKIRAVKARCPEVFVNARTDVYWRGPAGLDAALERLTRYVDAGADGVFVPGSLTARTIEALTSAISRPLNVLASQEMTRTDLAALGVARISTGSLLYRVAISSVVEAAASVRDGQPAPPAMSYDDVQMLHRTTA